jgi:RHS repeat-associated protein
VDWDGAGAQVASKEYYFYDGQHIALKFVDPDASGAQPSALRSRLLHGPVVDQILADEAVTSMTAPGNVLWPLTDNLGTVRDIVDFNETTNLSQIANHLAYDAFGRITSETNAAVDFLFGFTGRERDEESWYWDAALNRYVAGHYYYRGRLYDPATGRFLSQDPIGFAARDPNLYRYVGNGATNATDPSGLDTYWQNRKIGGSTPKSNYNKVSHGFIFTTDPDGSVAHTYSWGNTDNTHGWSIDQPEDIAAAKEALRTGSAEHRGGAMFDKYVAEAFNEMNVPERQHPWRLWNTCKTEARSLLRRADELKLGLTADAAAKARTLAAAESTAAAATAIEGVAVLLVGFWAEAMDREFLRQSGAGLDNLLSQIAVNDNPSAEDIEQIEQKIEELRNYSRGFWGWTKTIVTLGDCSYKEQQALAIDFYAMELAEKYGYEASYSFRWKGSILSRTTTYSKRSDQ